MLFFLVACFYLWFGFVHSLYRLHLTEDAFDHLDELKVTRDQLRRVREFSTFFSTITWPAFFFNYLSGRVRPVRWVDMTQEDKENRRKSVENYMNTFSWFF